MNIVQIEENVKQLIYKIAQDELNKKDFIYELLLAYGLRNYSINKLRSGDTNLAEDKENTLFWKLKVYFKIAKQQDLHSLIDEMKKEKRTESNKIRFLIVTDFKNLLAIDTKTQDTLDIPFSDLAKKFDFFLPWAGMEKAVYQGENPADVKAAEKLAKLFDEIKADNFDEDDLNNKENLHQLNIFLSRLLFCYFAEDTEIFKDKQFTSAISKSNEDGSDLSSLISRLFKVLNQSSEDRETDLPHYLADFPYVNGGLFKDDIQVPKFTRKSRRILIECGKDLDWSDINPDIFGSMFQAVVHTEQRSTMGQHYTSVPNIMKVIEPLFLNDLYEELEKNQDSVNKLLKLQQHLGQLKIFDPACGSGNFLIIAYKELRKFEMELLKRIQELELEKTGQLSKPFSVIQVSQFYGIEIDDFAHEIAILSLWLTEHQMNILFKDEFGESKVLLPLKDSGQIHKGNALLLDWHDLFNLEDTEIYVLGNPPYVGSKLQNKNQKKELEQCFSTSKISPKTLDYIFGWFFKASQFVSKRFNSQYAFVTTNSTFQGEQVSTISDIFNTFNLDIKFAYQSFKWSNNARSSAGVSCVIVGVGLQALNKQKILFADNKKICANNINCYLIEGRNIVVTKRTKSISKLPKMNFGNMANDGGGLILSKEEKENLLLEYPTATQFIKELVGANEFINGVPRYCIWIPDEKLELALDIPLIKDRVELTRQHRLNSKDKSCNNLAERSHQFRDTNTAINCQILIPRVSSENREYIPIGFLAKDIIILDSAMAVYDPELWLFSLLTSRIHMVWVKAIGGKLETRYRYSASVIYNNFPIPQLSESHKQKLIENTLKILSIRENYSERSIADLYHVEKMPQDLREAHLDNDLFVDSLYKKNKFQSDESRLEALFNLYEKQVKGVK